MLEEGPQQYNRAIRNIVFDIGISWGKNSNTLSGALALCLSALLHLLTTLFLQQIRTPATLNGIYIVVNTLAGFTLLYTWVLQHL
jgi:solute carrier family 45 protein 1/2/4